MVAEGVGDVLVACGLVVPAAVAGIVAKGDDVGELLSDHLGATPLSPDQLAGETLEGSDRLTHTGQLRPLTRSSWPLGTV